MKPMPTLFVSHGAPTYALRPGIAGAGLAALGAELPRPAAVLVVSAHWLSRRPRVGVTQQPRTVHDFRGFPDKLYEIRYPASGHPHLATRAVDALSAAGWDAEADAQRGLDHGAWVPLLHLYPEADVPVFQVSMPADLDTQAAFAFGQALAPLSADGVLIVGSGSLTHNLHEFFTGARDTEYASEFAAWIRQAVVDGAADRLVDALDVAPHARRAHPTTEHYLPLLVAAGAAASLTPSTVLDGGFVGGVLSMDSFLFGASIALMAQADASPAA